MRLVNELIGEMAVTEDFLRRWSRIKSDSRSNIRRNPDQQTPKMKFATAKEDASSAEEQLNVPGFEPENSDLPEPKETSTDPKSDTPDSAQEKKSPEMQVESDFDDVDFDALGYDSDYTRFMGEGVPEAIQRKALRKLWASNPVLANIDGLNDYDGDFTDAALAVDVIKTAYKVGSGYLTEEEQVELGMVEEEISGSDDKTDQEAAEIKNTETTAELNDTVDPDEIQPDKEARDPAQMISDQPASPVKKST